MEQAISSTRAQIDRTNAAFLEAFHQADGPGLGAIYTENGQILPPNSETMEGREQIQGFWTAVIASGVVGANLETVEVHEQSDSVWEIGKYTLYDKDKNLLDNGKYLVVWQETPDGWKWHRDIWNSSRAG
jgi:ketosteroid isomerase-like protein